MAINLYPNQDLQRELQLRVLNRFYAQLFTGFYAQLFTGLKIQKKVLKIPKIYSLMHSLLIANSLLFCNQ